MRECGSAAKSDNTQELRRDGIWRYYKVRVVRFDAARCPSAVLTELEVGLLIDDAVGERSLREGLGDFFDLTLVGCGPCCPPHCRGI